METLKKTIFVPPNHKLKLDLTLPVNFPSGEAEVILIFAPKIASQVGEDKKILNLAGQLKDSEHFNEDPIKLQRKIRDEWEQ